MKVLVCDQDDRVGSWVMTQTGGSWVPGRGVGIGLAERGELIAGVIFEGWNGASVYMHVAAVPGARWMTREYLWTCFAYPFLQLNVYKIIGLVGSGNKQAQRFDEHLGFVREATLIDAHPDGDLLVYTMTKQQCRWLNVKVRSLSYGKAQGTAAA